MQDTENNLEEKSSGFNPVKLMAALPFLVMSILYMTVWTDVETKVEDPWYTAVRKVDSAKGIKDPQKARAVLEEGGKELQDLAIKYPKHARLHFFLGYYYSNSGDMDKSIFHLKKAIDMGSGAVVNQVDQQAMTMISQVTLTKATNEIQAQQFQNAINTINKNLMYNPNDPNFYYFKGVAFQNLNQLDSARVCYEKAQIADKNHGPSRENLANLYYMMSGNLINGGNPAEAEKILKIAIKMTPNFAPPHYNLGVALIKQGKQKEAIQYLERAVYLSPKDENYRKLLEQTKKGA